VGLDVGFYSSFLEDGSSKSELASKFRFRVMVHKWSSLVVQDSC
jgi:hypothetical protein